MLRFSGLLRLFQGPQVHLHVAQLQHSMARFGAVSSHHTAAVRCVAAGCTARPVHIPCRGVGSVAPWFSFSVFYSFASHHPGSGQPPFELSSLESRKGALPWHLLRTLLHWVPCTRGFADADLSIRLQCRFSMRTPNKTECNLLLNAVVSWMSNNHVFSST